MTELTHDESRKRFRLILNLGKHRVTARSMDSMKITWTGTSITISVTDPVLLRSNVMAGDIVTLYTEIPYGHD